MKRIFAVLLALSLLLLAACSKGVSPTEPSQTEPATQAPTEPATDAPTEPSQTEPATEPSQPEEKGPFTVTYAHAQADTHGTGEVWVQLLAEVTNTGSEPLTLGAADWTVCTPDGTELAVRKGVSAYPQTIEPGERCVFPSGLAAEIPAGTAGFVFTRSGLGIKKGIHVTNGVGVIDSDYRGEIQIGLHNLSAEPYTVQPGERIAQMIIMPYFAPVIEEVTSLTETDRGAGGFGSTGTK